MARRKALLHSGCIIAKGVSFGDRRYRYKAYHCMTAAEREKVRGMYPHKTKGIPDAAYAYPINKAGKIAKASRTLLWSYEHTKRKTARYRR